MKQKITIEEKTISSETSHPTQNTIQNCIFPFHYTSTKLSLPILFTTITYNGRPQPSWKFIPAQLSRGEPTILLNPAEKYGYCSLLYEHYHTPMSKFFTSACELQMRFYIRRIYFILWVVRRYVFRYPDHF